MLHSVGLSQLPEELRDERRVSPENRLELQDYPLLGVQQLRACGGFAPDVMKIVRQHREHLDGSGFPEGASEGDIHPHAPIVGAIREFQLLTVDAGHTPAAALAQLYRDRRGPYGAWAVDNLIATLTVYPPGTFLSLSDGSIARVMRVSTASRLRPLVCLFDEQVEPQEAEILDLSAVREVSIASVLNPAALAQPVLDFFGSSLSGFAVASASEAGAASLAA
jgi:HD-GYP domain-containing protein (c-di-GMP phosphodiesterase class II)